LTGNHLEQIYDRPGVHSRAELALLLAREGLVELDSHRGSPANAGFGLLARSHGV
jgi:hypothetical protein